MSGACHTTELVLRSEKGSIAKAGRVQEEGAALIDVELSFPTVEDSLLTLLGESARLTNYYTFLCNM